ncbi:MFS transporter [Lentzea aerocolonigenes]|uniref:MFS transporter n=1 Tax=Lentzea aerocolonigenes TaxID=68170 RepID=A0A0F0HAA0_LENAE|nr:MFS transporter [Lentzea aerocolonigenes]KJK51272.1 MFS transporter [Lentzea aerocolonigenes]
MTTSITLRPARFSLPRLGLPKLVWALAATQFVGRAGGVVRSFLVLYLTQAQHLSPATAGTVVAALGVGDIGSQLLGGWLGDRIGRRNTMLVGFVGAAVALALLGSADSVPEIWAAAVAVGLTVELHRPAGSAAVADLPAQQRIRAFGLLYWAANLGFSVATVAAGVLAQYGYGLLFWINVVASLVAALIVWRQVPETRPAGSVRMRQKLLPVVLRDRRMIAMMAVHVGYFTLFLQTFTTLPLLMTADGLGPATYGAVLALNGIAVVALQPVAVRLLSGRSGSVVSAVSMLLVGAGAALGALSHGTAAFAGSVLIWTLGQIGIAVRFGDTFADLAPAELRGGYMGLASTTWSVGAVLGPLTGTALLDLAGPAVLGSACAIGGIALFFARKALS